MISWISGRRGYAIVVVLAVVAALSVVVVALSRRSRAEVTAVKYAVARMHAEAAARSGVRYVAALLKKGTRQCQTAYDCGLDPSGGQVPEKVFSDVKVDDQSTFTIGWFDTDARFVPGVQDEAGRLNLNSATADNTVYFSNLLMLCGLTQEQSLALADAITQWREPATLSGTIIDRQDNSWYSVKKVPKHHAFENIEELALVSGVEESNAFSYLAPAVTVFPVEPGMLNVNLNTANEMVVRVLAVAAGASYGRSAMDVEMLVWRLIQYRKGPDGLSGTTDDRPFPASPDELGAGGSDGDAEILQRMRGYQSGALEICRFISTGGDTATGLMFSVEVVLQVSTGKILMWNRI